MSDAQARRLLDGFRRSGDVELRNQVVEAHLPLARHVCREFAGKGVEHDDLVQVATVGLLKAAENFEADRGVPFAAYAAQTMNGELKRWFRDRSWAVRPPRSLLELANDVRRVQAELSQELQRLPTTEELAERLAVSNEEVRSAIRAQGAHDAAALDRPGVDGEPVSAQVGHTDPDLGRAELREAMATEVGNLDPLERRVVRLRFWGRRPQREIAERVGLSQMQVSRILQRVLRRLRRSGRLHDD